MAATDFDYIATRNEIIEGSLRIVGALEIGEQLSADMLDQGVKALQLLIKSWANKHLFLWSFNQSSFNSVANQEVYSAGIDAAILGVEKAWIVDSNDDLPLEVVSYSKYLDFYDKETNTGEPRVIAFKPTPSPTFYLWPSPDAIYTIKILCPFALHDFDTADGTGELRSEFQRALKYGLAEDLFDEYPGPMNERQFIQQKAEILFREAKKSDLPRETTEEVESLF